MNLVLIKYNAGNIQSVSFALERLGISFNITDDAEQIRKADKVIFPGVGEASTTMTFLKEKKLDQLIKSLTQPVLGVCLGMQLMCRFSEENNTPCLGIFDEDVKRFIPESTMKVPHMGWNKLLLREDSWLNPELSDQYVYFVHSFYVPVNRYTSALTDYINPFSAALKKDNFYGVQFHPEKSASTGELVLKSFLDL
ncbi:imidazole glycerol phosphate synthase subunit HisH [Chryseosolibacter indicus]|uniref:Imidazole glycerol phosphate synthase subunit HisH n=1 Tax=Chryseosolibacter indicus TaxID=2782351 RepID=A0ABS5VSZ0_9BACT|nr:imidazole glycerol phosphate synthase subunit HisH [Chryseosolibacter indicus]MBT1704538.1 imidazole glycerol phosphate synthase subunit HisH [Chryseosolibacter indicus]